MSILAIFDKPKPKPFDLPAFLESWPEAPRFMGKRKVDPPVGDWLEAVRAGCVERKVPEKQHVAVARALMGEKAIARLEEFERVLSSMKGGEYQWDWEKFKMAMTNLGWEISKKKTSPFTIAARRSGRWWVIGKKDDSASVAEKDPDSISITSTKSFFKLKRRDTDVASLMSAEPEPEKTKDKEKDDFIVVTSPAVATTTAANGLPPRRKPMRAMSDTLIGVLRNNASASAPASSDGAGPDSKALVKGGPVMPPAPKRANTDPIATTTAIAPLWLVNATTALDFLTAEYPRTISALSAILLAAGSIPAIAASGGTALPVLAPAMQAITAAGGGGIIAALGSSTAVAVGAVATGLGSWLKSQNVQPVPAPVGPPAVQAK